MRGNLNIQEEFTYIISLRCIPQTKQYIVKISALLYSQFIDITCQTSTDGLLLAHVQLNVAKSVISEMSEEEISNCVCVSV